MSVFRKRLGPSFLLLFSLGALVLSPFVGLSMTWPIRDLLGGENLAAEIFWRIRVPRVFLGFITGAALGGAGVVFQAIFRNPLASPYTFGVASAAAFGAALSIVLGFSGSVFGLYGVTVGGLFGALFVATVICCVAFGSSSSNYMLLAGVAFSFFFSSLLLFVQYLSNFTESFRIVRWLMGGLEVTDYSGVMTLAPFVLFGLLFIYLRRDELDVILTGDELAYSRGVEVERVRMQLFFGTSIMVGAVVSFTGPIGFVGVMVPHFCRILLGPSHRLLVPYSILSSGSFLICCDALARVIVQPADLPVGIITSLLGGPFFIWVLLRRREEVF
ncbi:hypothetical protein BVY02_02170 [bacterium J17]|nr:hypothetical protein BVY02_02170 [bacterium J17]